MYALRLPLISIVLLMVATPGSAQQTASATQQPLAVGGTPQSAPGFAVESYYRVKWGYEDEFMALFRKNHLPFLKRQLAKGVLLAVRLYSPQEHMPEEARWNLRMTLVYRDAATAYASDNITEDDYRAIVPSDEAEAIFKREEQRRFELLDAHWDINVKSVEVFGSN